MSSLAAKPLVAVSLLVPSLILLGYLWQRRRAEEAKANQESTRAQINCLDSKEVSLKLESLNRSRLDCIEEEDNPAPTLGSPSCDLTIAVEAPKVIAPSKEVAASDSNIPTEEFRSVEISQESAEVVVREIQAEPVDSATNTSIAELPNTSDCEALSTNPIMTEKDLTEVDSTTVEESVPDVNLALKDPLCNSNPTSPTTTTKIISSTELSSSPVKSETSDSQKSYESWSDLIEQDEREEMSRSMNENLKLDGECGRHDSGVASPSEEFSRNEPGRKGRAEVLRRSSGDDAGIGGSETGEFSDSGHSSEVYCEDSQIMAYHFYVQDYLCGSFIGVNGSHIKKLKSECNCNVILKNDRQKSSQKRRLRGRERKYGDGSLNLCIIEGTRTNIDKCLDMIRDKFYENPELTLEQINKPDANLSLYNGSVTLSLAEGIMHDVCVSSIVNGGHIFVQQPGHPTFSALERLDNCMYNTYTQLTTPELSRPILQNSICVVNSSEGWYRCQVVGYHEEEDVCDIKYIDYGGYDNVPADSLRQIRTDFLSLPFQAIECYLANVVPTEEDTVTASVLEELVAGQVVQARMIGMNEDGIPMVHLYRALGGQTVMVNRELVDRSCANWIEATIVPLVSTAQVDN